MTLAETLRDRRILMAVAGWTVLNVVLAWGAAGLTEAAGIAWEAHLGGFYCRSADSSVSSIASTCRLR